MKATKNGSGALPSQKIRELIKNGAIKGADKSQVSPSSLDLTISDEVYRVERLFLPVKGESVRGLLDHIGAVAHNLDMPMERGVMYVARLNESFKLPKDIYGFCNPKSSTGRNDIHARILADGIPRYDDVAQPGWSGELWIAMTPKSYPVIMPPGFALSQLRLFDDDTRLTEADIKDAFINEPLLYGPDDKPLKYEELTVQNNDGSLTLTIDLECDVVGYECFEPSNVLDLGKIKGYEPNDYFRKLEKENGTLVLKEGHFYILSTLEKVRVPPTLASEMRPMDERYGDFRSHYAGFFDPGWGWGEKGEGCGRTITLEVRPFENLEVRHGQAIGRIRYERVSEQPDMLYDTKDSNYLVQNGPKLAKQFKAVS